MKYIKNIIIFGTNKYKFTDNDLKILKKRYKLFLINDKELLINLISDPKNNEKKNFLIVLNTKSNDDILEILQRANIKYLNIETFLEKFLYKCYVPYKFNESIDALEYLKGYSRIQYLIKRLIDIILLVPLSVISIPIILYSVYRIKKESPNGSIFFKQKRVGLYGKTFICYKLRSMHPDAEKEGPKFATKNDPRVFKWGRIMRKYRIDELPQLWNVIKGDMHIIGPRPERPEWVSKFERQLPYYKKRHLVKPGITGWAQVMYPYAAGLEDTRQKLMFDLFYIKNWSFFLELRIIFKTITVILRGKGT